MKNVVLKALVLVTVFTLGSECAYAQGFMKKLKKSVEKVVEVDGPKQETASDTTDSLAIADILNNPPVFLVKKVCLLDDAGKEMVYEDGTTQYRYLVIDSITGKVCTAEHAKKVVKAKSKVIETILKKVGTSALNGAVYGGLASGDLKGAGIGAGAGAATGVLASWSDGDFKKMKALRKNLKEYDKVLEKYQKTFTEEGLPIDANMKLSEDDEKELGLSGEISKSSNDIIKELEKSKEESMAMPE